MWPLLRAAVPGQGPRSGVELGSDWSRCHATFRSSDISCIPLRHGYLYLVAVMDWYSRYVLSWRSVWTAAAERPTTCSSSGCGEA